MLEGQDFGGLLQRGLRTECKIRTIWRTWQKPDECGWGKIYCEVLLWGGPHSLRDVRDVGKMLLL